MIGMRSALRRVLSVGVLLVSFSPAVARAQSADPPAPGSAPQGDAQQIREELDRLRREFEAVRDQYGARLTALEQRLTGLTGGAAIPPQPPQVAVPSGAADAAAPTGALPVYGSQTALSKIFNPDISVIGNFVGATGNNEVNAGPPFEMQEAEVTYQAVIDPYARADFFFAFSPEGVEMEEAFMTFPTLPGGFLAKVGKMKQQIGKVNTLHPHALAWVDKPLFMENLFGGPEGLADSGISLSKLLVNPLLFLEATGEVYQGNSGLFASNQRNHLSWVGRLRGYRDVTESTNLDVGASFARGHYDSEGPDAINRAVALDATFRYRPLRRAIYRSFMARTELVWTRRDRLSPVFDPDGEADTLEFFPVPAFGMYLSGDYQFARRWFAGARYDWSERALDPGVDKGPSLLLTFRPSEFSRIRGQFRRIKFGEDFTTNEVLFQFLFSIGTHGAHVF